MTTTKNFRQRLQTYKQTIDADIAAYAAYASKVAHDGYGVYGGLEADLFLEMLGRGGKRLRGALVMHGYAMSGGHNLAMILQAARAIEMLHAYMLIIDDIQDNSAVRRGKPTVHVQLAGYHRSHGLKGDSERAGINLALNVAIAGSHAAQIILANLDADPQLRLNAISITNRTLAITVHGQMHDVMHQYIAHPKVADLERVLEWKTALYSFINPLHVGMVLAGANCQATDAITPYARHIGRAFQVTDDILGVFGDQVTLGKSPLDDIREGKITVLMHDALAHAAPAQAAKLRHCLGNARLTPEDLTVCQEIITACGARGRAQKLAKQETAQAIAALDQEAWRWPAPDVAFLKELAAQVLTRVA